MSAAPEHIPPSSLRIHRNARTRLIATALVLAFFGTASAHDASKPEVEYHPTGVSELHAVIDQVRQGATPEQTRKVDAVETAAAPELERLGQAAITAHHHKIGVLLQERPDRAALKRARADELHAADALATKIDEVLIDLAKTLTPEQRAQFRAHNGE